MSLSGSPIHSVTVVEDEDNDPVSVPLKHPPKTCEEWLTSSSAAGHLVTPDGTFFIPPSKDKGVVKWPIHAPYLDILVAAPQHEGGRISRTVKRHKNPVETILGTMEDIKADLRKHAPWHPRIFDNFELKYRNLEANINKSACNFVDDYEKGATASSLGGLANITGIGQLSEQSEDLLNLRKFSSGTTVKQGREKLNQEIKSNLDLLSMEVTTNATTVGSCDEEFTVVPEVKTGAIHIPLPAKLDSLGLLNTVYSLAKIPTHLKISWKKVYFSNEFVSIFENAFWWMWFDYFKPNKRIQALLFDQIAQDFVTIFTNLVDDQNKDAVFMRLPVFLAQALYSAFCHAFPDSNWELNTAEFLEYLSNTTSEWMIGVKSQPMQWQKWPRHFLNPHFLSLRLNSKGIALQQTSTNKELRSAASRQPPINLSTEAMPNFSVDGTPKLSADSKRLSAGTGSDVRVDVHFESSAARMVGLKGIRKDSVDTIETLDSNFSTSQLETGPVFECVRFSIYGRSPLLQHYLQNHHLTGAETPMNLAVTRTQIKDIQQDGVTYTQVVKGQQKRANKLYQEYQSQIAQRHRELVQVRNKHIAQAKKTEKVNQHLLQHRHEVARLAERLVASKDEGIIEIQARSSAD